MIERFEVRCVHIKDSVYIKKEDVVNIIREIAGTETTDVRNRLEELARNFNKLNCTNE